MKQIVAFALLLGLVQTYPPPFPREGVTKILENDYVVAWDAHFPQNVRTAMHEHALDVAAYLLTPGQVRTTLPDGTTREGKPFNGGHVVFNAQGVIHIEEWLTDTHAIGMELKTAPTTALTAADEGPTTRGQ
jgi:hypothetical protein